MDNRPAWVPRAEAALARGDAAYKEFAEIVIAAMDADPNLTQAAAAEMLGHKPPWLSKILDWHRRGCAPGGPFAPEAAARRAKAKAEISSTKSPNTVSTSKPAREYWHGRLMRDGPWRQPWLPGLKPPWVPEFGYAPPSIVPPQDPERDAAEHLLRARAACDQFVRTLRQLALSREVFLTHRRSYRAASRRKDLESMIEKIESVRTTCDATLDEIQIALREIPQVIDDEVA